MRLELWKPIKVFMNAEVERSQRTCSHRFEAR